MARRPPAQVEEAPTEITRWRRVRQLLESLALFFAATGGLSVVAGGILYIWIEELQGFAVAILAVGGGFILVALVSSFTAVRSVVTGQRGRYTANALTIVLAFLIIAVLVNFISYENFRRFDTTFTRHFSLSPQTLQILENLDEPVEATGFFVPTRPDHVVARQEADDLMFEFRRRSSRRFTYEFVDPEAEPSRARQFNATQFPVIVFEGQESGNRIQLLVPPVSEQDLTSALLIVTGEQQKKVYFLTGHGEKDITDTGESSATGYFFARRGILSDNYQVQELNLRQAGGIPDDTAVLVIAGPQKQLLTDERKHLAEWLRDGGRALFLLDPNTPASVAALLEPWGILVGRETIVDLERSVSGDPRTPLLQRSSYLDTTLITSLLDVTFFPQATPVNVPEEYLADPRKIPPWVQYYPLAVSSLASFATEDPDRNSFGLGDTLGPHTIGLAVQALAPIDEDPLGEGLGPDAPVTNIVVLGDSDFATNQYFSAYTNADLLLNAVNWLAEDYDLISVRPKLRVFRLLGVTRQEFDFIRFSSWFFIPVAVAFVSIVAWWRRR